jgi:hypothetical protein
MGFTAPIGISDFRKLRQAQATYVDKTAAVASVLRDSAPALLFPRPRRFGKTLWMSTLEAFVARGDDDRSELFGDLAIWRDAEARRHLARYPVVSMTFKDVKYTTWDECMEATADLLARAFEAHREVRSELDGRAARVFDEVVEGRASKVRLAGALAFLSEVLHRHHGERVVLLVDEYDTPIHAGHAHGYYDEAVGFFRNFLSGGLKDNPHLFKGVLTGVMRVARESIFSGLNNLAEHSLLRPEHADTFGFTEDEVAALARIADADAHLPVLREWYDGYVFGGRVIYNPWSVLQFLASADRRPRAHWVATAADDVLRGLILRGKLGSLADQEALLRGETVTRSVVEPLALRDVEHRADAAWSLLLFSGYLTAAEVRYGGSRVEAALRIPNREVRGIYEATVLEWLEGGLGASEVDALQEALLAGQAGRVAQALERLFVDHVSYHDLPRPARELPYHMFVLGLLVRLAPAYEVRSNHEAGLGRADVLIAPRTPGKPGVVMELKRLDPYREESTERAPESTVEVAIEAALAQIAERDYAAALRARGATPVHAYAVVFDGKRVHVRLGD